MVESERYDIEITLSMLRALPPRLPGKYRAIELAASIKSVLFEANSDERSKIYHYVHLDRALADMLKANISSDDREAINEIRCNLC